MIKSVLYFVGWRLLRVGERCGGMCVGGEFPSPCSMGITFPFTIPYIHTPSFFFKKKKCILISAHLFLRCVIWYEDKENGE